MNSNGKPRLLIVLSIVAISIIVVSTAFWIKLENKSNGIFKSEMQAYGGLSGKVEMPNEGVTLLENDEPVAYRNYNSVNESWDEKNGVLLENLLQGDNIKFGKNYEERITVENTGENYDMYVRVTIRKWWSKGEGGPDKDLDPSLIEVNLNEDNTWLIDEQGSNSERIMLYYKPILQSGERTSAVFDSIRISPEVGDLVSSERTTDKDGYSVIEEKYKYNDYYFNIEVDVEPVQTHNAEEAASSAWGVKLGFDDNGNIVSVGY